MNFLSICIRNIKENLASWDKRFLTNVPGSRETGSYISQMSSIRASMNG